MHKIEVPSTYQPNLSFFYRKDRERWVFEYDLPSKSEKIRTRLTLPKSIQRERQIKAAAKEKERELTQGLLTDKEFEKFNFSKRIAPLTFDQGIEAFINLADSEKRPGTKKLEKRMLGLIFKFFKEKGFDYIHEVKEDDVFKYKQHLLSLAGQRIEAEGMTYAKMAMTNSEDEKWRLSLELKRTGLAPATARSYFKLTKTFFNRMYVNKKLALNPAEGVEVMILKQDRRVRSKSFEISDLGKILNAPYVHPEGFPIKEFFEFKLETGARLNEILCLEWPDLDLTNGVWELKVKPQCPTTDGIGFKPKWGKERKIPLSQRAVKILRSIPIRESVGYVRNDPTPYPGQFVFTTRDYRKRWSPNNRGWCKPNSIKKAWATLLKKAGLEYRGMDKHHLHDLRRLRNAIDQHIHGLSDQERSLKLGHSQKVNKEHYSSDFDQTIVNMSNEIRSLKAKILMLNGQLNKAE